MLLDDVASKWLLVLNFDPLNATTIVIFPVLPEAVPALFRPPYLRREAERAPGVHSGPHAGTGHPPRVWHLSRYSEMLLVFILTRYLCSLKSYCFLKFFHFPNLSFLNLWRSSGGQSVAVFLSPEGVRVMSPSCGDASLLQSFQVLAVNMPSQPIQLQSPFQTLFLLLDMKFHSLHRWNSYHALQLVFPKKYSLLREWAKKSNMTKVECRIPSRVWWVLQSARIFLSERLSRCRHFAWLAFDVATYHGHGNLPTTISARSVHSFCWYIYVTKER